MLEHLPYDPLILVIKEAERILLPGFQLHVQTTTIKGISEVVTYVGIFGLVGASCSLEG